MVRCMYDAFLYRSCFHCLLNVKIVPRALRGKTKMNVFFWGLENFLTFSIPQVTLLAKNVEWLCSSIINHLHLSSLSLEVLPRNLEMTLIFDRERGGNNVWSFFINFFVYSYIVQNVCFS